MGDLTVGTPSSVPLPWDGDKSVKTRQTVCPYTCVPLIAPPNNPCGPVARTPLYDPMISKPLNFKGILRDQRVVQGGLSFCRGLLEKLKHLPEGSRNNSRVIWDYHRMAIEEKLHMHSPFPTGCTLYSYIYIYTHTCIYIYICIWLVWLLLLWTNVKW